MREYNGKQKSLANRTLSAVRSQAPLLQRTIEIGTSTLKSTENHQSIKDLLSEKDKLIFDNWLIDKKTHKYKDESELIETMKHRTDYHFGLNVASSGHGLGPRMDYIDRHKAGTIAEYDWRRQSYVPDHIEEADHERLSGSYGVGSSVLSDSTHANKGIRARTEAANYKRGSKVYPDFSSRTRVEKYIWGRKALNSAKGADSIRITVKSGLDLGVDFSKAALVDQLVQGKDIHMHLTGFKTIWKPGHGGDEMTGKDYIEALDKTGDYGSNRKGDVSMRELRFVYRYWTNSLSMLDDDGKEKQYKFEPHTYFYYGDKEVDPPWKWPQDKKGSEL